MYYWKRVCERLSLERSSRAHVLRLKYAGEVQSQDGSIMETSNLNYTCTVVDPKLKNRPFCPKHEYFGLKLNLKKSTKLTRFYSMAKVQILYL